jgi:hypothetical protein
VRILGVDPGVRGGLAIIAIEDSAAPRLIEAIDVLREERWGGDVS